MSNEVKKVKEQLAAIGITDIPDDEIKEYLEMGVPAEEVVNVFKELKLGSSQESKASEPQKEPVKQEPIAAPQVSQPQANVQQTSIPSIPVDSSVKKTLQKEISQSTKDTLQRVLSQIPPKGKVKIYIWNEDTLSWAYLDSIPSDIFSRTDSDIHAFLKKKYAKYEGVNKFKLEFFDALGNKVYEAEVEVYVPSIPTSGVVMPVCDSGGDVDVIYTIKSMFEKMEQEKDKLYNKMLELQKQLASKEIEQAERTMELLKKQIDILEETYQKKLSELQQISQGAGSEVQTLIYQLSSQFEKQLNDMKNLIMTVVGQVSSTIKEVGQKKDIESQGILQLIAPVIQTALAKLSEKEDSFEKMIKMLEFLQRTMKTEQVDPVQQLKTIMEIVQAVNSNKVDPTQQFQTLFSLVKEMLPKQKDSYQQFKEFMEMMKLFMPKEKDPLEELQKLHTILDMLGLKKDDSMRERLIIEFMKEMKESQRELIERLSEQQMEILEKMAENSKRDDMSNVIAMLMQQQQQQMEQMKLQMQVMMEQMKNSLELVVNKIATPPPQPPEIESKKDPIEKLLDDIAKLEKLKSILGNASGGGGGSIWGKLLEGLGNALPAILQAAQQTQPIVPQQPVGFAGYQVPPTRVIAPRRRVRRIPVAQQASSRVRRTRQVAPPRAPMMQQNQGSAVPKQQNVVQRQPQQPVGQVSQQVEQQQVRQQQVEQQQVGQPIVQNNVQQGLDINAIKEQINVYDKSYATPEQRQELAAKRGEMAERVAAMIKAVPEYHLKSGRELFASIEDMAAKHGISVDNLVASIITPFDSREQLIAAIRAKANELTDEQVEEFVKEVEDKAKDYVVNAIMNGV